MAKKTKTEAGIETVRVRFLQDDSPFRKGEEKDCTRAEAEKFARQGVAEYVKWRRQP